MGGKRGKLITSAFLAVVAGGSGISAWISSWPGVGLRLHNATLVVGANQTHKAQTVWVFNPTSDLVHIKVNAACGCTDIRLASAEMDARSFSRIYVTPDWDALRAKPYRRSLIVIRCSTSERTWDEQLVVEAI